MSFGVIFCSSYSLDSYDVDVEIWTQDVDALWTRLSTLGYFPTGSQDLISAPGGKFKLLSGGKCVLDRSTSVVSKFSSKIPEIPESQFL